MTRFGFLISIMIFIAFVLGISFVACDDTSDCDQNCFDEWDECVDETVPHVDSPNFSEAADKCNDEESECMDDCDEASECG